MVSFYCQQTVTFHHDGAEYWPQGSVQVNEALGHVLKVRVVAECLVAQKIVRTHLGLGCGCESTCCGKTGPTLIN